VDKINLADYIICRASKHDQDKIALQDDVSKLTYKELGSKIKIFAQYLIDHDVRPGDRLGILMGDCVEWCIGFFSTLYVGANPVLLSPRIPKKNISAMIRSSNARFLIYDNNETNLEDLDIHSKIVCIDKQKILLYGTELQTHYEFHPDELTLWCSSSGTSGKGQKFVLHRHQSMLHAIDMNVKMHNINSTSVIFSTPKLSYQYGLMDMVYGLAQGGKVIVSNKIPVRQHVCDTVKNNLVTHLFTTPTIIISMIKTDQAVDDIKSVNYVLCGGESLPKFIEKRFFHLYKKNIFNGIGMAEILTWATSQTPTRKKTGTIGVPMPGTICEVRNTSGGLCAVNEIGELYIKQKTMALMYWNSLESSIETFSDGWFKTKDMVYWDQDGYLIYVCRKDDLIRVKESYVNPIDIEEEILQHPAVEECVVIGVKNKFDMPEILSKIVIKDDYNLVARDVRKFLKNKLEIHKIPKYIDFVDVLPKTVTTKKIRNTNK